MPGQNQDLPHYLIRSAHQTANSLLKHEKIMAQREADHGEW